MSEPLPEQTDNRDIPADGPQPSQDPDLFPLPGEATWTPDEARALADLEDDDR